MRNFFLIILAFGLVVPRMALTEMSSGNYQIYADTFSVGGLQAEGGIYSVQDTLGESPVGSVTGGSYQVLGGYQWMEKGSLSLSVSSSSLSLGTLTTTTVALSTTTITITTDAGTGYVLSLGSVSGTHLTDVADGEVTAGSEEYGLSATSTTATVLLTGDEAVTNGNNIASYSGAITGSRVDVVFKAAMSSSTTAGSYSQTVTLRTSANF